MSKIRVAHVITRLCRGGAQENTVHTVRLANRARFDVDLISGSVMPDEDAIEDAVLAAGMEIIHVPTLMRPPAPLGDLRALRRLTALFRAKHYDIVHTHTSKAGFLGRIAARRAGVPIVIHTPHGNIFEGYFPPLLTRLFTAMERYAARRTDRIITLTPGGIDEHLAQGIGRREQYEVVFSGIDFAPYTAAIEQRNSTRHSLGIGPNDILIGGVGRLEPVKGFTHFVSAAHTVAGALPQAQFVLAGDGSLREELHEEARALGKRFRLLGWSTEVAALMAAMDVCVVPSINEGMGRVVLEAGAAATPVVATHVGGIPDIVRDGVTGILIPPRDPGALANAVIALVRDASRRCAMGKAARAHVVPHYSIEQMVAQIEAIYEALIEEKHVER